MALMHACLDPMRITQVSDTGSVKLVKVVDHGGAVHLGIKREHWRSYIGISDNLDIISLKRRVLRAGLFRLGTVGFS